MTEFLIIIGAISTDSLLSALIGIMGSRRKIGFGWSFLISAIFTPIIGLIAVLLSNKLPQGDRKWGCIAPFFILAALATIILIIILAITQL